MKNILLICQHPHIDTPLRRSLAHLVNSCYIEIIAGGHLALDALKVKTFDLIIIDSALPDIDSLELIESIDYMDPGLPIILMVRQEHRLLWGPAQNAGANPILRPFKPLAFLRLVDTLLHAQLERYRELAKTLELGLITLSHQTHASLAFLVESSGSILLATTNANDPLLEALARLVIAPMIDQEPDPELNPLIASQPSEADHELYSLAVTDQLRLAVLLPIGLTPPVIPLWLQIEVTGYAIKEAFIEYEITGATSLTSEISTTDETLSSERLVIPLKLEADLSQSPLASSEEGEEENLYVNWQIISNKSTVLNRLQEFCQIN
jgi:DNA-binding NarL/FixJ family response regulator